MVTRQRPTLLTFEDEEGFNEAKTCLSTKGVNIHQAGTNQFRYSCKINRTGEITYGLSSLVH
jgi:hypothetical protein